MAKQKYKTLHVVTYDDPDFGRTSIKPGVVTDSLPKAVVDSLLPLKAIVKMGGSDEEADDSVARAEAERVAAAERARLQAEQDAAQEAKDREAESQKLQDEAAAKAEKLRAVTEEAEGMTKAQLSEALTKAKAEFDAAGNKAALVEAYVAHSTK